MPNINGGHYYLTALIPVRVGACRDHQGLWTEPVVRLRRALGFLPAAHQSRASLGNVYHSPFARGTRTHFVRFAVIDAIAFNGRQATDAVLASLRRIALTEPRAVDQLACPYLLFAAEFDTLDSDPLSLESWLGELWRTMPMELNDIFRHCVGWQAVDDAADFGRWIRRCQIETTLPFGDYWIGDRPFRSLSTARLVLAALAAFAAVLALTLLLAGGTDGPWWVWLFGAGLGLAAAAGLALRRLRAFSAPPWPAAPGSDLPSILKALYLQREFVAFAESVQGADPETLHARFGAFLAEHQPASIAAPTQQPGILNIAGVGREQRVDDGGVRGAAWVPGYGRTQRTAAAASSAAS